MLYRQFSVLELDTVCTFNSANLFFLGPNTQCLCWDRETKKLAEFQERAVCETATLHIFSQADLFKFSQLFSMAITESATVSDGTHTHSLLWTGMWNIKISLLLTLSQKPKDLAYQKHEKRMVLLTWDIRAEGD